MARPTASNINTIDIDEQYPVAGVDNDSQGFRDNFDTIKTNFVESKAEIEDLMDNTARLDVANDFNGNDIQEANFIKCTKEVHNNGNLTASQNLSFNNGSYQIVGVGGNITLTLSDWPITGRLGEMRVVLKASDSGGPYTVSWSTEKGGSIIKSKGITLPDSSVVNQFPDPFVVESTTNPLVVDFWTDDSGAIVYAKFVGEFD